MQRNYPPVIVERYRRLSKDYERLAESTEAFVYLAFIKLMRIDSLPMRLGVKRMNLGKDSRFPPK